MQYHFCGIGGSGMSALAQVLAHRGHEVQGSDRAFDGNQQNSIASTLQNLGIVLVPQDGSGLHSGIDELVTSTAVEAQIPDVQRAQELGIPLRHRAAILADMLNEANGIAVAGTSGKTTVTGMIGAILKQLRFHPTVVNGGVMLNARNGGLGNAICGDPDMFVAEADESDGSLVNYWPRVGLVTNIGLDHKPLPELLDLFAGFVSRAGVAVVNNDCQHSASLLPESKHCRTFGFGPGADVRAECLSITADQSRFRVNGHQASLRVPGRHNIANALAAVAAVEAIGVPLAEAVGALEAFRGIHRRLERIGTTDDGIFVVDDFAHNPDKIAASLAALHILAPRLRIWFQPHGFGPTRFLFKGLTRAFGLGLRSSDALHIAPIFYAGGTAERSVSSEELAQAIAERGRSALGYEDRERSLDALIESAEPGDCVAILGARDPALPKIAREVLARLQERKA